MKNRVLFWSSTPNNLACRKYNGKRPQWHPSRSLQHRVSRPPDLDANFGVKAETHVIMLHTTRKFVTATPTTVTRTRTDNKYSMELCRENILPQTFAAIVYSFSMLSWLVYVNEQIVACNKYILAVLACYDYCHVTI